MMAVIATDVRATDVQPPYSWDDLDSKMFFCLAADLLDKYGEDFETKVTPADYIKENEKLASEFETSRKWNNEREESRLKETLGDKYQETNPAEEIQSARSKIREEILKQNRECRIRELEYQKKYYEENKQRLIEEQQRAEAIKFTDSVIEKFENENLESYENDVTNALKKLKSTGFNIEAVAAMQGGKEMLFGEVWSYRNGSISGIDEMYTPVEQLVIELAQRKVQQNIESAKQAASKLRSKGSPIDEVAKMQDCKATLEYMLNTEK